VVGSPQATTQRPHEVPEKFVGKISVYEEQILEILAVDRKGLQALVRQRGCGARRRIDERHLSKVVARPEHSQRLLAHPRNDSTDTNGALEDDIEFVASIPFAEHLFTGRGLFFLTDVGDSLEVVT